MQTTDATVVNTSPATLVIKAFGGVRKAARALGVRPSTVCRWNLPLERGGMGGQVPSKAARKILMLAKQRGLELTADDLLVGR
jgi:hypothetical protein